MMEWLGTLIHGDFATAPTNIPVVLLGLLLAFLGGHAVAWVYIRTHSGLSFSRTYVNSLILIPMIVSMVMVVLANNLVTAFGMMAVFAIVRFRNVLRDTLDTTYILVVIAAGMACGTQKFATAAMGVVVFVAVVFYLHYAAFGRRHRFDVIVNLRWGRPLGEVAALRPLFIRHTRRSLCASQRSHEGYEGTDLSYRLLLRDPQRVEDFLSELRLIPGVSRVTSILAQDESEL